MAPSPAKNRNLLNLRIARHGDRPVPVVLVVVVVWRSLPVGLVLVVFLSLAVVIA